MEILLLLAMFYYGFKGQLGLAIFFFFLWTMCD